MAKIDNIVLLNEDIKFPKIKLIIGNESRIVTNEEAQRLSIEQDLDLWCVQPSADPPVCKILDYGKMRFTETRKERSDKKNRIKIGHKEIQIGTNIGKRDLEVKLTKVRTFLIKEGSHVRLTMRLRGRMNANPEQYLSAMNAFVRELSECADIQMAPTVDGSSILAIVIPKKNAKNRSIKEKGN